MQDNTPNSKGYVNCIIPIEVRIRESVHSLCRDGTDMRGDAQNPKSFQAPRM